MQTRILVPALVLVLALASGVWGTLRSSSGEAGVLAVPPIDGVRIAAQARTPDGTAPAPGAPQRLLAVTGQAAFPVASQDAQGRRRSTAGRAPRGDAPRGPPRERPCYEWD